MGTCEGIKDTFKLKTKPPHPSELTDKEDGSSGRALRRTLGWESKGKLGQRGQRGCVVHSALLLKEMILLMWATDGSRMDLSAPTKVWMDNGVPRSAVVTFALTER